MKKLALSLLGLLAVSSTAFAGPYTDGTVGTSASSTAVLEWADAYSNFNPGPQDIAVSGSPTANFGVPQNALGASDALTQSTLSNPTGAVVSLGDGGSITLSFATPIANGPGADFSVFENGFTTSGGLGFLELATVSVSSDGVNFFTFPDVSLTQTTTQVGSFGTLDPTNLYDLAGKTFVGIGANFDLSELAGISGLNINDITDVKVTDVVGSINPLYGTLDSKGNLINDPFPTAFGSGGFDLDAVAVLNDTASVPEPSTWALFALGLVLLVGWQIRSRTRALALVSAAILATSFAHADNIDFSSLASTLPDPSTGGGNVHDTSFSVGGATFSNTYDPTYDSWAGFAYSNTNETTAPDPTADYNYQYYAAGTGIPTFALAYADGYDPTTITFSAGEQPTSLTLTNDLYTALSMENGDMFAKKFGPGDFLLLTITGYNTSGATPVSTGSVSFYLANFLSTTTPGYIVNQWTSVDLSALGAGTNELSFDETSSDVGTYGINTPTYFALGGITVADVPEPSTYALLLVGGIALLALRKRVRA
jgi:Domain of unknown function (DUF4465)/PEP-CTERM motif